MHTLGVSVMRPTRTRATRSATATTSGATCTGAEKVLLQRFGCAILSPQVLYSTWLYLVEEIVPRLTHASQLISMETVGTASATETVVWVDCIMSLNLWVSQDAERQKVWKHGQCTVGVCRRLWSIRQQLGSVPRMFFAKTSLSGNMWTQPKQTAVDLWA